MESFNIEDPAKYVEELLLKTDPLANQPNAKKKKQAGAPTSKDTKVLNYNHVPQDIQEAVDKIKELQDWQSKKSDKEKQFNQNFKSQKKRIQEFLVRQGEDALIEHNGYVYRAMVSSAQERLSDKMLLKAFQDLKNDRPDIADAAALYYIYIQKRRMKTKKNVKLSIRKTRDVEPKLAATKPVPIVNNTNTSSSTKQPPLKKQKIDHPVRTPTSANNTNAKPLKPKTPTTGQEELLPDFYDADSYSQHYRQ